MRRWSGGSLGPWKEQFPIQQASKKAELDSLSATTFVQVPGKPGERAVGAPVPDPDETGGDGNISDTSELAGAVRSADFGVRVRDPRVGRADRADTARRAETSAPVWTPQQPPPDRPDGRAAISYRVYAVVALAFALVCVSMFVAIVVRPDPDAWLPSNDTPPPPDPPPDPDTAEPSSSGGGSSGASAGSSSSGSSSGGSSSSGSSAGGTGPITVRLVGDTRVRTLEVSCPGEFRVRADFEADVATVTGVPNEACSVRFLGGAPAKYGPVKPGTTLNCRLVNTTADCSE